MAEVSNLHQQPIVVQEQDDEEDLSRIQALVSISNSYFNNNNNGDYDDANSFPFDFNPLSPPNMSFFVADSSRLQNLLSDSDSLSETDSDSDCSDSVSYTTFFHSQRQIDFVTDLFDSRDEYVPDCLFSDLDPFPASVDNGINFRVFECSVHDEFRFDSDERIKESSSSGLRVANIDSDSDSDPGEEDPVSNSGTDRFSNSGLPICWTSLGFDDQMMRTETESEESDWEELSTRVAVREGRNSVIDRIEEISVSSDTYNEDEQEEGIVRDLEWEMLLAVNNLERNIEFFIDGEFDDYMYAATNHYDSQFGHFLDGDSASSMASPPASKSFIENLQSVMFTEEELDKKDVVCAVCRDDIVVEETVTKLPCSHHYHRSCILPWLKMRNTCPICRFELPTDDVEYEGRKNGDDLQVIEFGFENFD